MGEDFEVSGVQSATQACGKLWSLDIHSCKTGYIVTQAGTRIWCEDECRSRENTWAFTTKAEAIAFIRKHIDGKDG
jgi:hypothetical protein